MKWTVYLIRHGKTEGNLRRAYIGVTDQPLCEAGKQELAWWSGRLPRPDALWCSPLLRCRQTAQILYPAMDAQICQKLRECDFGAFEGKNYEQLKGHPAYQRWLDSGGTIPFPGGEDPMAFRVRSVSAFQAIVRQATQQHPGGTLAIVCHGGTIMAVLESLVAPHEFYRWQVPNAGGYRFSYDAETGQAAEIVKFTPGGGR